MVFKYNQYGVKKITYRTFIKAEFFLISWKSYKS